MNRPNISFKVTPQDGWTLEWLIPWLRDVNDRFKVNQFTWDPGSVSANSTAATVLDASTIPVLTEMRTGMVVALSTTEPLTSGIVIANTAVETDATLTVTLANVTAGAIDPGEFTWIYWAVKS